MIERELTPDEVKSIYQRINELKIDPIHTVYERKYAEEYYELDGKQYRLIYTPDIGSINIYTPDFDWFCDIIYEAQEGKYV